MRTLTSCDFFFTHDLVTRRHPVINTYRDFPRAQPHSFEPLKGACFLCRRGDWVWVSARRLERFRRFVGSGNGSGSHGGDGDEETSSSKKSKKESSVTTTEDGGKIRSGRDPESEKASQSFHSRVSEQISVS